MTSTARPTVAVIGAGVAGLTAAHLLRRTHDVTLHEAQGRLGGHAHTHDVSRPDGGTDRIDSGFIVHNDRTYPHLTRLFQELGVETQSTEMSMSIRCDGCGLAWAGGRGAGAVLAQPRRLASPRFLRMLTEIPRFHRAARRLLADGGTDDPTWGDFLRRGGYSRYFVDHFALPLVTCVWSSGATDALDYPARHLFAFLDHHGMLSVSGSPTWRTVVGGSATYVDAVAAGLPAVRTADPVTAVSRHDDGVDVRLASGATATHDRVVLATHPDQTLAMLADATPTEKSDLAAIRYSRNQAVLHRDPSHLPVEPRARASWNHRMDACGDADRARVTYWMNRLHALPEGDPATGDYLVSLNPAHPVPEDRVIARMEYSHPVFTREAVAAAERLQDEGGDRLAFAGAWLGWGFHEDGCRSGVAAAARFGVGW